MDAHFQKHVITEVSANISEYSRDKTYVRINFQRKILDNKGNIMKVEQIEEPDFYQAFFSRVDKAIFLNKENI